MIDPRTNQFIAYWDLVTTLGLVFTAIVTPFEVAFLEGPRSVADIGERFGSVGWLFCVNRLLDMLFTIDLVLQFRLMYPQSDQTEVLAPRAHAPHGEPCSPSGSSPSSPSSASFHSTPCPSAATEPALPPPQE